MRYWIDTEFIESGPGEPIYLLSIGIVAEDGREFYGVVLDAPYEKANDWVKANVIPHLPKSMNDMDEGLTFWAPHRSLASAVKVFVNDHKPEFWGYYADYDWVVFCQIFGAMIDLPKGWPMYMKDLKQWCDELGNPKLPKQESTEHNALHDARWNRKAWEFLKEVANDEAVAST